MAEQTNKIEEQDSKGTSGATGTLRENLSREAFSEYLKNASSSAAGGVRGAVEGMLVNIGFAKDSNSTLPDLKLDAPQKKAPEKKPQTETTQLMADGEFASVAKQVLAKVDTGSGQVTLEQLGKAIMDPQFKGKEAQALAALYHNFSGLHNLSKHEGWLDSASITAADLDTYESTRSTQSQRNDEAAEMKNWAQTKLPQYDTDNSGSLTKSEITNAINDPSTPAADRKVLEAIQNHYSEMSGFWDTGLTQSVIGKFADNIASSNDAKLIGKVSVSMFNVNIGQGADICHDVYSDKNDPLKSINVNAIRQGSIGDCYFEASLAAVATAHPEMIKDAIKDNGDGTFTVTFPGAKDEPIMVKAPTEAEQGLYNHASQFGTWASVMEKAYGEYCQAHFYRRSIANWGEANTPTDCAGGGGRATAAMEVLTGHDVSTATTSMTYQSTMATYLDNAFSAHPAKAVTASILPGVISGESADGFQTGHVYTITNFVPDGNGGGSVTVRNPWAGDDNTPRGTMTIPLSQFRNNFSLLFIEK